MNADRPPVDLEKLRELTVGMTENQAIEILGTPTKKDLRAGNMVFSYQRLFGWDPVEIYFDRNRRYARNSYDR